MVFDVMVISGRSKARKNDTKCEVGKLYTLSLPFTHVKMGIFTREVCDLYTCSFSNKKVPQNQRDF